MGKSLPQVPIPRLSQYCPEISALRVPPPLTGEDVGQPAMGKDVEMPGGDPEPPCDPLDCPVKRPTTGSGRLVRHKGPGSPGALTDNHIAGVE